jgi:alpha amylase-like protein
VAINNNDTDWNSAFSTSLPDGQYCDVISGTGSSGKCTGTTCVIFNKLLNLFLYFDVIASVSPCLRVHSPLQYPLETLLLFIQLHWEVNLLLWLSNKLLRLDILGPSYWLFFFNLYCSILLRAAPFFWVSDYTINCNRFGQCYQWSHSFGFDFKCNSILSFMYMLPSGTYK